MSSQSSVTPSTTLRFLIQQSDSDHASLQSSRLKFGAAYVAGTVLAGMLSFAPIIAIQTLIDTLYRSIMPSWGRSDPINPIGLLDIVLYQPDLQEWQIRFGLLTQVSISTLIGIFIGVAQWLVLRQYLPDRRWLVLTVLGCELAGLLTLDPGNPSIFYSLMAIGGMQWLILRYWVKKAWVWILTYPLAIGLVALPLTQLSSSVFHAFLLVLSTIQAVLWCKFERKASQFVDSGRQS